MRILFYITKSEQGGAQTHVAQLTSWLIQHGHEVAVMSKPGGWLESQTRQLGGRFLPNTHLGNTANLLRIRRASQCFLSAVSTFKPDLVTCHSTMAGLIGRFSLRGQIPTIFTAHGWGFQPGTPLMRRLLVPFFERLAARFSRRIICVSRHDLELAHTNHIAPMEKLVHIYNGIKTPDPSPTHNDQPVTDEMIRIAFVGRLAPPKNPLLLVEAIARLPREVQNKVRVIIIGNGPDRTRLEGYIHNQQLDTTITLLGALPREAVLAQLCDGTDLFVLLSRWEGFPYAILEAMAAGVPVIASRAGGIPEALEQGGGILVGTEIKEVVNALQTLINDKHLRTHMGGQARAIATSSFGVEAMCEKTFAVYEQALIQ